MLIEDQFGIIEDIQKSPILQASFMPWTFFSTSDSKIALAQTYLQPHYGIGVFGKVYQLALDNTER